jgi:hypothetical protein
VAQSVLLSLDGVAGDSEAAAECRALLELVSVLSLAGVPRELLRAESGREPRQADEAIGRLAERSLLSFSGDDDLVVAHRMVMRVVRERAQRQGTLAAAGTRACGLLNTALDSLDDLWGHRTDAHDFVDQVISLSQNLRPCLGDNPELTQALLDLRSEALFLRIKLGDAIGPAVEFGESLRADCLRLHGGKHRQTLWAQNDLARAYQAAGRTDEAIALHEESLAVCTRKLGAAAPEAMTARDELARAYQVAGRLDEPPGFTNKKWAGSRIPVRAVADVGGDPGLAGDRDQGRRESRLARLGAVDHRRQADDAGPHPAPRTPRSARLIT